MGRPFQIPESIPLSEQRGQSFPALVAIMQRLLAADGCPWDREQNFASLRKYVLEEACEVIDAIDSGDREHLREELGDLALQVAFLGELARNEGSFGPDDVVRAIVEKLVRRHPHVFAEVDVKDSEEVVQNWERIKAQEKSERGVIEGVPRSLPALYRAQRMSEKVSEELNELDEALASGDSSRVDAELGDMLFALVNLARHAGVDAETALRGSCDRFAARFAHVEQRVKERHGGWPRAGDGSATRGVSLEVMDGYWDEAKRAGK
jgi:tetrapyrrole methylase family protein/MazG family protein/ATP diphosphatase